MSTNTTESVTKYPSLQAPAVVGLDLAKNTMHLHALDACGNTLWKRTLKTNELIIFLKKLPSCLIGIEACGGSNYWHRTLSILGHTVHIISPMRVKAFVEGQKNDKNDAAAIANAAINRQTRIIPPRTIRQQEIGSLHAIRILRMKQRTQNLNHMRGLMNEYGVSCRTGALWFENHVQQIVVKEAQGTAFPKLLASELLAQAKDLEDLKSRIQSIEKHLSNISQGDACKRLMTIPGIGVLISTMLYAYAGNPEHYKTGRGFAASLGLVPRQYSTGGKQTLGKLSKRGDTDIRTNLILGSRSALMAALKKRQKEEPPGSTLMEWALRCYDRKGMNLAAVALANKIARIAWKVLKTEGLSFCTTTPIMPGKERT